jgi:SAM domain (Sterile alpha motif)
VEATVDVAAWLKNLGLGQYEAAFRDNAIEGDLLPSLTAEDLKDLGVTIVGHRRKLLDAIAALGPASKPTPPSAAADRPATLPAPAVSSQPQSRSGADAERRHDHSHVLRSRRLDKSRGKTRRRGLAHTSQHLSRRGFGGGDRAWRPCVEKARRRADALFGYPHAQENDAERAVRAALAIQRALVEINAKNASKGARSFPRGSALIPGRW